MGKAGGGEGRRFSERWRSLRFPCASSLPTLSHRSAPRNGDPSTSTAPMASPSSSDGAPGSGRRPYLGAWGIDGKMLVGGSRKKEGTSCNPCRFDVCLDQTHNGVCAVGGESTAGASGRGRRPRPGCAAGRRSTPFFVLCSFFWARDLTFTLPQSPNSRLFATSLPHSCSTPPVACPPSVPTHAPPSPWRARPRCRRHRRPVLVPPRPWLPRHRSTPATCPCSRGT